jgi:hypothetical protein
MTSHPPAATKIEGECVVTKTCIKCQYEKELGEFRPLKPGTHRNTCRPCENKVRRANVELYQRALAKKRAKAVAKKATLSISDEISELLRDTGRRTKTGAPLPPLPTAEELAAWWRAGCPIRADDRERAA